MYPHTFSHSDVIMLQKTVGNQAVGRLINEIGLVNSTPKPFHLKVLQGKFDTSQMDRKPFDEEPTQMKNENKTRLPNDLKSGLESLSGLSPDDFSVHYSSDKPSQIGASAYAEGKDTHVASGQEKHLPHEALHVVKHVQGRAQPTIQRMPLHAIDYARKTCGEEETKELEKISGIISLYAYSKKISGEGRKPEMIRNFKDRLLEEVRKLTAIDMDTFIEKWNSQLNNILMSLSKPEPPDPNTSRKRPHFQVNPSSFSPAKKRPKDLSRWMEKSLKDKKMTPRLKLKNLMNSLIDTQDTLPEDIWVALELFFVHTATFTPENMQGRDMIARQEGSYFRTSTHALKDLNRHILRNIIPRSRMTYSTLNVKLLEILLAHGRLSSNIAGMELFQMGPSGQVTPKSKDKLSLSHILNFDATFGRYQSAQGSHVGSVGLPSNAFKTMRSTHRMQAPPLKVELTGIGEELARLGGIVDPNLLQTTNTENYHDFLLGNRAQLVKEISDMINGDGECQKQGITAIQSPNHPSLIVFHQSYGSDKNEKEWREKFIVEFNRSVADLGYQTQLTHRGSFGFLYPTASSVGGPVRIWPGIMPDEIFRDIMISTINMITTNTVRPNIGQVLIDPGHPPLHIETLKTAVARTLNIINTSKSRYRVDFLYQWLLNRVESNLKKANLLLQEIKQCKTKALLEQHYLKTTSVVENLMEYGTILIAMTTGGREQQKDVYPEYASKVLLKETTEKHLSTFYLDSGMQAIVAANILAKAHINKADEGKTEFKVLNMKTYFEYDLIKKDKLCLKQLTQYEMPDIISADLSPVFTARDVMPEHKDIFAQIGANPQRPGIIVPIIDITNSTLSHAASLDLDRHYANYIIVESLSKHHQLGGDKYTMGRLIAVGDNAFLGLASEIVGPIAEEAYDPLWANQRLIMDKTFYGNPHNQAGTSRDSSGNRQADHGLRTDKPLHGNRGNQSYTLLGNFSNRRTVFRSFDRGIRDLSGRENSCGFLVLGAEREAVQETIIGCIRSGNPFHPLYQRILNLLGDEIYNSIVSETWIRFESQYVGQIQQAIRQCNDSEQKKADAIANVKKLLLYDKKEEMNIQDAITAISRSRLSNEEKETWIAKLLRIRHDHDNAILQMDATFKNPGLIVNYLQHNMLGEQPLSINTARAWAIIHGIELHVWTHQAENTTNEIVEISPQDVTPGRISKHMLHTLDRTHFQELIPLPEL